MEVVTPNHERSKGMVAGALIRGLIVAGGAVYMAYLAKNDFSEKRATKNIREDLDQFFKTIANNSEAFVTASEDLVTQLEKLDESEELTLTEIITVCQQAKAAEQRLPSGIQATVRKLFNLDKHIDEKLKGHARKIGLKELEGLTTQKLSQQYLILYLIGRAGTQLDSDGSTNARNALGMAHAKANRPEDRLLMEWCHRPSSVVTDRHTLLGNCSEVQSLGVDARYICYALGEQFDDLSFDNIIEDLLALEL